MGVERETFQSCSNQQVAISFYTFMGLLACSRAGYAPVVYYLFLVYIVVIWHQVSHSDWGTIAMDYQEVLERLGFDYARTSQLSDIMVQ